MSMETPVADDLCGAEGSGRPMASLVLAAINTQTMLSTCQRDTFRSDPARRAGLILLVDPRYMPTETRSAG